MKRLSYIFIFILGILITYTTVEGFQGNYFNKVSNIGNYGEIVGDESIQVSLTASSREMSLNELISSLINFAEKNNVSLLIERASSDELYRKTSLKFIYSNQFKLEEELYFKDNINFDFSNINEERYFTTDKSTQNNSILIELPSDKYCDGINYNLISIMPLHQFSNVMENEDTIFVNLFGDNIESLVNYAKDELKVSEKDITLPHLMQYEENTDYTNAKLIILVIILILILTSCYVKQNKRQIGIRKLHGNSSLQVINSLLSKYISTGILYFLTSIIITYTILVKNHSFYSLPIIKKLLLAIVIFLIGYICLIVFFCNSIKRFSVAINIKKTYDSYNIVEANIILKIVIMILMIAPLISLSHTALKSTFNLSNLINHYDLSKYRYSIDNIIFYNDERYDTNCSNIYNVLNKNGAIYIDDRGLQQSDMFADLGNDEFTPILKVNKNYLQDYEIILENGEILNTELLNEYTYIVPEKYESNDINKRYSLDNYEIVSVKDGTTYYNPTIYSENVFINDPVLLIVPDDGKQLFLMHPYILFSNDELIKDDLEKEGLDEICSIYDTMEWFNFLRKQYITNILNASGFLILYIVIILVFLYHSIYLYIEENKRLISIEYLLGYSKLKMYSKIFVVNLIPYSLVVPISIAILKLPIASVVTFIFGSIIIEFIFTSIMLRRFERNTVIVVLKGQ